MGVTGPTEDTRVCDETQVDALNEMTHDLWVLAQAMRTGTMDGNGKEKAMLDVLESLQLIGSTLAITVRNVDRNTDKMNQIASLAKTGHSSTAPTSEAPGGQCTHLEAQIRQLREQLQTTVVTMHGLEESFDKRCSMLDAETAKKNETTEIEHRIEDLHWDMGQLKKACDRDRENALRNVNAQEGRVDEFRDELRRHLELNKPCVDTLQVRAEEARREAERVRDVYNALMRKLRQERLGAYDQPGRLREIDEQLARVEATRDVECPHPSAPKKNGTGWASRFRRGLRASTDEA